MKCDFALAPILSASLPGTNRKATTDWLRTLARRRKRAVHACERRSTNTASSNSTSVAGSYAACRRRYSVSCGSSRCASPRIACTRSPAPSRGCRNCESSTRAPTTSSRCPTRSPTASTYGISTSRTTACRRSRHSQSRPCFTSDCCDSAADQIDAELSEEGGNIILCQAEGSLSVGPYNRKYMHKPYCVSRNEQPGARLAGGSEGGRFGKLK